VLAFKGGGKIEKADYETVLEPAVKAMAAVRGEVRLVVGAHRGRHQPLPFPWAAGE
jgi:hypothetical protein